MAGIFVLLGGIALFAGIITLLDLLARRQKRKLQPRP